MLTSCNDGFEEMPPLARRTLNLLIPHLSGARREEHAWGRYLTRSSDAWVTCPCVTNEGSLELTIVRSCCSLPCFVLVRLWCRSTAA